jgi:hypothetical protein
MLGMIVFDFLFGWLIGRSFRRRRAPGPLPGKPEPPAWYVKKYGRPNG